MVISQVYAIRKQTAVGKTINYWHTLILQLTNTPIYNLFFQKSSKWHLLAVASKLESLYSVVIGGKIQLVAYIRWSAALMWQVFSL